MTKKILGFLVTLGCAAAQTRSLPAQPAATDQRIAAAGKSGDKTALAASFLQKLRETGDPAYIERAGALIDQILAANPGNRPAQRLRLEADMHLHRFAGVAERAGRMLSTDASDAAVHGLLGDALMELGRYREAGATYRGMLSLGGNLYSFNRMAWYEFVTGNPDAALGWMAQAIQAGSSTPENTAWCLVEMGDMLSKLGRTADAERAFYLALQTFPGYHRANAGLGRLAAERDELTRAIQFVEAARSVVPLPEYVGLLASLYQRNSDSASAARQWAVIEALDRLGSASGEKANRTLAVIYADAGLKLDRALALARAELDVRDDVYSHDALAWVLFKHGRLAEARVHMARALALNTPEPSFHRHAQAMGLSETAQTIKEGTR